MIIVHYYLVTAVSVGCALLALRNWILVRHYAHERPLDADFAPLIRYGAAYHVLWAFSGIFAMDLLNQVLIAYPEVYMPIEGVGGFLFTLLGIVLGVMFFGWFYSTFPDDIIF